MSLNFHTAIIAASRRRVVAPPGDFDAFYLFDASDASKITDTGGSPNLITDWENSASGANALTLSLSQATTADQPQWDGTKLTFADNSDYLEFSASVTTPGWVVVGTSLGTFAYKTNSTAWEELALLGRAIASVRALGDLYGIILLPADASTELIDAARSEMIAKGAADGLVGTTMFNYFRNRGDMVEFRVIDTSSVTNFIRTWQGGTSLESFPLINTAAGTNFNNAWFGCSSLTDFPANFFDAWNPASITSGVFDRTWTNCNALTPASVENILTSLDTSGKYGRNTGLVSGTILADNTIDITYNGSGLTAATTTAITNLKGKDWQIEINGVLQ